MEIYLPIAEMSVSWPVILGLGFAISFLSGVFGIGGGFLLANDDYGMDKSFRSEMKALFPENPLVEVPLSHPVYSSVHKLAGLPKIHEHEGLPAKGLGIFFDKKLVVFYAFSSDIGDGMEDLDVHHDGPELHALALQEGLGAGAIGAPGRCVDRDWRHERSFLLCFRLACTAPPLQGFFCRAVATRTEEECHGALWPSP